MTAALHRKIYFIAALTHYKIDFLMHLVNVLPHRAKNVKALFSQCASFQYSFDKPDLAEYTLTCILEFNFAILWKANSSVESVQGCSFFSGIKVTDSVVTAEFPLKAAVIDIFMLTIDEMTV